MSEVSQVVGYIDPIHGDDNTAQPNNPDLPYQHLDFFYEQQRPINPTGFLLAEVTQGVDEANLLEYQALAVNSSDNSSRVSIFAHKNQSIRLVTTFWTINTNLTLEEDPFDLNPDVPAVITEGIFFFGEGRQLNILEQNSHFTSPNRRRNVFQHNFIADITESGSSITLNRPGTVHFGPVTCKMTLPSLFRFLASSAYYEEGSNSLSLELNQQENTTLTLFPNPTSITELAAAQCFTTGQIVVKSIQATFAYLSVVCSPIGGKLTYDLVTTPKCPPTTSLEERLTLHENSENPVIRAKVEEIRQKLAQGTPMIMLQRGTFINTDPTQNVSLTDIPDILMNGPNVVGMRLFATPDLSTDAKFNAIQNFDSYYNNGSLFREPIEITSDFVHEEFDGTMFMVNAATGPITIIIPDGVISDKRIFEYKRVDRTKNRVVIIPKGGLEGRRRRIIFDNKPCQTELPYIRLYGFKGTMYIMTKGV